MEYKVHRCKFSDWTPSPVRSIAVDPHSPLVAVGREQGDIEVSLYLSTTLSCSDHLTHRLICIIDLQLESEMVCAESHPW